MSCSYTCNPIRNPKPLEECRKRMLLQIPAYILPLSHSDVGYSYMKKRPCPQKTICCSLIARHPFCHFPNVWEVDSEPLARTLKPPFLKIMLLLKLFLCLEILLPNMYMRISKQKFAWKLFAFHNSKIPLEIHSESCRQSPWKISKQKI